MSFATARKIQIDRKGMNEWKEYYYAKFISGSVLFIISHRPKEGEVELCASLCVFFVNRRFWIISVMFFFLNFILLYRPLFA